jgi:hypothetical protein
MKMTKTRVKWPFKHVQTNNRLILVKMVRECASLFCRIGETSRILGCSHQAFTACLKMDEDVSEAWEDGLAHASMALRRTQLELAKKAPGMAIFLGKNYLGQVDEPKVKDRDDNALKRQLESLPEEYLLEIQQVLSKAKEKMNALPGQVDINMALIGAGDADSGT